MLRLDCNVSKYLNLEGQIINLLQDGPLRAGEIYKYVNFSQPVVSKKLARMQECNIIFCYRDISDHRVVWYEISNDFLKKMLIERDARALKNGIFF